FPCEGLDLDVPRRERLGHRVAHAAGDGIVELAAYEGAPRQVEHGPPVAASRATRERRERFGKPLEPQLELRIAPLERRARAVHPLESPGVPIRPPQLAAQEGRLRGLGAL